MDTWLNGCFRKMDDLPVHATPNNHPSKNTFLWIILAATCLVRSIQVRPQNSRDDLCLFFCLYPSSMLSPASEKNFLFILGLAVYCPKNINHGWSRCNCMVRVVFLVSVQELQLYLIITCNEKYQTFTIRYPLQLCFRIRLFFQPSEFDFLKGQCHEIFTCLIPLPNPLIDMLKHFQYDFYFAE